MVAVAGYQRHDTVEAVQVRTQRKILRLVRDRQRRRGGAVLGEIPHQSMAWKEPMIIEAFDGMESGITDMCQFKLRIPGGTYYGRGRL